MLHSHEASLLPSFRTTPSTMATSQGLDLEAWEYDSNDSGGYSNYLAGSEVEPMVEEVLTPPTKPYNLPCATTFDRSAYEWTRGQEGLTRLPARPPSNPTPSADTHPKPAYLRGKYHHPAPDPQNPPKEVGFCHQASKA